MVLHKGLQLVHLAGGLTVGFVIDVLASGRVTEASAHSTHLIGQVSVSHSEQLFTICFSAHVKISDPLLSRLCFFRPICAPQHRRERANICFCAPGAHTMLHKLSYQWLSSCTCISKNPLVAEFSRARFHVAPRRSDKLCIEVAFLRS